MISRTRFDAANKKAKKIYQIYHYGYAYPVYPFTDGYIINIFDGFRYRDINIKAFGMYRSTRCFCSRACCGNPRKHFGELTLAEVKSNIDFREQLSDIAV